VRATSAQLAPDSRRALILEPFATEQIGTHDADPEIADLRASGFQVDQYSDQNVTVNVMTTLWQYNVVYMHTHSGVNQAGYSVIATGETFGSDPSLAPYVQDGYLWDTEVAGLSEHVYGILDPFITQYENRFPDDSLLYLDGCMLLRATVTWQNLQAKNVGALVTWDDDSSFPDESRSAQTFFHAMALGMTVIDALQVVHQAGEDTSVFNGKVAHLGYLGNGYITLQGHVQPPPTSTPPPPTATSAPTTAATAPLPTATATPSPTPTTSARLSLTVRLKHLVAPGSDQVIRVASGPDIPVHIRVLYPNGDGRSGDVRTGSDGAARYTYRQPRSKIRHGMRDALVTVTAGTGPDAASVSRQYRIRFSAIDVSAEPRVQAVGKLVNIWVHAQSHVRVTVTIRVGARALALLTALTGPAGWAHRGFTVAPQFRVDSGEVVTILASARSGGRTEATKTRFRVQ
jgi:hypothetical protein